MFRAGFGCPAFFCRAGWSFTGFRLGDGFAHCCFRRGSSVFSVCRYRTVWGERFVWWLLGVVVARVFAAASLPLAFGSAGLSWHDVNIIYLNKMYFW